MIPRLRKNIETEEGQTIILGAVMVLVLAFGLLVTINLGEMVQNKIRLQNTSDAASYSMAVSEAQVFNFIAFSNRTQVAHYNGIMTAQTLQTVMLFVESTLGTILDITWFLRSVLNDGHDIPGLSSFLVTLSNTIRDLLIGAHGIPGIIEATDQVMMIGTTTKRMIGVANTVIFGLNLAMTEFTGLKLAMIKNFIIRNDSRAELSLAGIALTGVSLWEYLNSFDFNTLLIQKNRDKSGNLYDYSDPTQRPTEVNQRIQMMGEIANATRTESRNGTAGFANNVNRSVLPFPLVPKFGFLNFDSPLGQTKLLNTDKDTWTSTGDYKDKQAVTHIKPIKGKRPFGLIEDIRYDESNFRFHPGDNPQKNVTSSYPRGDTIGSDQVMEVDLNLLINAKYKIPRRWGGCKSRKLPIPVFGTWTMGTFMYSDSTGGEYYRWQKPSNSNQGIGLTGAKNEDLDFSKYHNNYARIPINVWKLVPGAIRSLYHFIVIGSPCECAPGRWKKDDDFDEKTSGKARGEVKENFLTRGHYERLTLFGWKKCNSTLAKLRNRADKIIQTHRDYYDGEAGQLYTGIDQYLKFKPDSDVTKDFNQPSTWNLLNLPLKNIKKKLWHFNTNLGLKTLDAGGNSIGIGLNNNGTAHTKKEFLTMTTTDPLMGNNKRFSSYRAIFGLEPGINVVSRGRVYYHRPGNWTEHPNFFNPYWRAQLAPIAPKLTSILKVNANVDPETPSGISGVLNSMLGGIISFLNGTLSDILSRVVTH